MEVVSLNVTERTEKGTANSNRLRKEGFIPCVMYGQNENIHFAVRPNDVKPLIYTPDFKLAEINSGDATHKCVLREIQTHPVTDEVIHLDFLRLQEGHRVIVEVPLHFTGTSVGVRNGGRLNIKLRRLKVKLLPENIIQSISVDITKLGLGDTLRVRDIEQIEGVEVLVSPSIPIVSVKVPRVLLNVEEESTADETGEGGGEESTEDGGEEASGE